MKKDLFDDYDSEVFFCPLDGLPLIKSKWEWLDEPLLTCSKGHVWEVRWSHTWENKLEFEVMDMVYCPDCKQLCPRLLMEYSEFPTSGDHGSVEIPKKREYTPWAKHRKGEEKTVCPDCFEKIKEAWRPDLERSFARLTISPIRQGDKVNYDYEEEIHIEPYPNPYHGGGCWGGGRMTEAEVEECIKRFQNGIADEPFTADYYGQWKRLGVKFEVIRKPEMTVAEFLNERDREYVEEHPEEAADHSQMRLIA